MPVRAWLVPVSTLLPIPAVTADRASRIPSERASFLCAESMRCQQVCSESTTAANFQFLEEQRCSLKGRNPWKPPLGRRMTT